MLLALLLGTAGPARAQTPPSLVDDCFGVDHPPFDQPPPPGANSILIWAGSFGPLPPGADNAVIVVDDPSGTPLSAEAPIDETGRTEIPVGIQQYGEHTIRSVTVNDGEGAGTEVPEAAGRAFDVSAAEQECRKALLEVFAAPTTTTTAAPTTTTAEATSTTPSTVATLTGGDESGSFRQEFIIPIVIGAVVFFVGVVIYYRTRERPRPGGRVEAPDVPPTAPGAGPAGGVAIVDDGDDHTGRCDWAAYYDDSGMRVPLRRAQGHECCVLVVKVTTRPTWYAFASRARQDAGDDRLRLFDVDADRNGLDIHAWVSARTAHAGTLDWVQADVPPPLDVHPDESYSWRFSPHSEPPDAAIHILYGDSTTIQIDLQAGCPMHQNAFDSTASTKGYLEASQECTNVVPGPECPVELTASSYSTATFTGDINYEVSAVAGSDVDELDEAGATLRGNHVDSHEHDSAPRQAFQAELSGGRTNHWAKDTFQTTLTQTLSLDAGAIVPTAVSPTTERASADAFVRFEHDVSIDAVPEQTCSGDCCGHGECLCEPAINLTFAGGAATITCDGETYTLKRPLGVGFTLSPRIDAEWDLS